jgi:hypothetical protein
MPDDRTRNGSPAADLPARTRQVRPLGPGEIGNTLADKLSPMADKLRQIATKLGVRRYRVFMVHVMWSGAARGAGLPKEISRREILPTPKVSDMQATTNVLRQFGLTEEGGLVVDEISAAFTEDDLVGKTPDLVDPTMTRTGTQNAEFFWEVVEARNTYPLPTPRRYVPSDVPMRRATCWRVSLTKVAGDRDRRQGFNKTVS